MTTQGFDSIPAELVAAIFQHCLPNPSDHLWPSSLEAPLLLAQICRRWREICLDTPNLWTSIAFGETRSIELLEEWLLRARRHPLTIHLKCRDKTRARMLVDAVKPYCLQWQHIHFALPLSEHRQLNTSTFPYLERLTLYSTKSEPLEMTDPVIVRDAPLLREAKILYIPYFQINIPMEKLAILHVARMYIPQIITVLRCCPNLVDLTCRLMGRLDRDGPPTPVKLPALRSLTSPTDEILHWLTLPRLERLHIRHSIKSMQAAINALHAFVSRSSCTLKFLSVRFSCISSPAAQMQQFFRAANTIEHLNVSMDYSGAPLLQALGSVDVLPRLRHLEVCAKETMEGDRARALLDLLAWRRTHTALESFELDVNTDVLDDLPTTIMAEFRALGEAGLHVRVTTGEQDSTTPSTVLLDTLQPSS
ncbi:hypothetical protein B0H13DRAFT_2656613 [Mycena leptocephala]|nr:hypothetical protein B0H13DRAFT_2656613 [Mycena leptocephala]